MGNDWWSYLDRLETMVFFTGYPLIYATVLVINNSFKKKPAFLGTVVTLLPFAYALAGTLFLGLILRDLYPDYSIKNISVYFDHSYLKMWGLLSLLFWIPLFAKKKAISLFHSLLFFFFFAKDIFFTDHNMMKNEIKIYTDSLLLHIITLTSTIFLFFLIKKVRGKN